MLRNIILLFAIALFFNCKNQTKEVNTVKEKVKELYSKEVVSFQKSIINLEKLVQVDATEAKIQKAFLQSRLDYKKVEFLAEYFNPVTAKSINGPALDEVAEDDPSKTVIPPEGLQVIEEYIFPNYSPNSKDELAKQIKILNSNAGRLAKVASTIEFTETHIFDAIKLQLFRIFSLGITGFDSPIANHSIPEAASSLSSLKKHLSFFKNDTLYEDFLNLNQKLDNAISYLHKSHSFNEFDRMDFVKSHLNPIYNKIFIVQQYSKIPFPNELRAFSPKSNSLFDLNSFNVNYFAPDKESHVTEQKVELGKVLFFDPILSGNNKRSCASCHNPDKGFSDSQAKSIAFDFKGKASRNSPTIINAGLQSALFSDSRVIFLEDQATDVLSNVNEMHGSMQEAVVKLKVSEEYLKKFKNAYPQINDPVNEKNIKNALATYTRSLTSMNSKFDQHMRGEIIALNEDQVKGFNLFMGKAKCATCHFAPLFNGVVPPAFENTEAEVIGVPESKDTVNASIDPDLGKWNLYAIEKNKFAFKTPTLRNIELTAPYMHNGVFNTLEEVIDFYNRGGGKGLGIDLPNQTLPEDRLNLTIKEKRQIIAFMKSLTDTAGFTAKPKSLPLFKEASLNSRKVGGDY